MSIEPTCDFCGYSDKLRCKSQTEANGCLQYKEKTMPTERRITFDSKPSLKSQDKNALAQLSLTQKLGTGKVTVSSHQSGVAERLTVTIERDGEDNFRFLLFPHDIDPFIDTLTKVRTYTQKGTL